VFMMDKPLYNSIIIKNYVEFLNHEYPDVNTRDLLDYAGINAYELEDRGHWLTQTQVNRFHEYMSRITAKPDIARQAGRFVCVPQTAAFNILRRFVAGFLSPAMAYWAVEKVSPTITRHSSIQSKSMTGNKIELNVTLLPGVKEEKFQCENRTGTLEAIAKIATGHYATIEHPECIHKGDTRCRYIISWESPKSQIIKKVGYGALAASILASLLLFSILSLDHWLIAVLSSLLLSLAPILTGSLLQNREMALNLMQQSSASEDVIEQINLRYNESLLIREIGEAVSSILDPKELLSFITESLHKRLMFDRCMVMLANKDNTKLVYSVGYGFTPHEEALMRNMSFSLINPESRRAFYQTYKYQKPIIIDNTELAEEILSEKDHTLVRDLSVNSFISIPITYKNRSEGVLVIDISKLSDKPTQSNISMLIGIAQQIGVGLNNAIAHQKIQENEQRFRNLCENAPDIIYQMDTEGGIKYVNQAWEEILGHQRTDIEGKSLFDFLRQEDKTASREILQQILHEKLSVRDKYFTIFNSRGFPRHIAFSGTPDVDAEGKVVGIVGTIKDITRLRSMEAQLLQASKMEAMGTLTGGIAHDFNNIIQAIMGYNQLMISGRLGNEEDIPYLNSIGELITRSRELVRQLLLFSKKVEPFSKVVNINEEVKSIHNLLSKSIPKMIEIKTDLFEDIFPVNADSSQIGQIIMNLVINARDAMGEYGIITIKTGNLVLREKSVIGGQEISPGSYVQLSVADTGCGMDEEMMKRIFEPFFTTKEPSKGTGLGLAVVHGIVRNHDGHIYCESKPNQGTTFYIYFPASTGGVPEIIEEQPRQNVYGTEKILLVDDEKSILETVRDTLTLYGYQVVTAESGEQATDVYRDRKNEFDLVILDLIMPGAGGKKCLQELLQINPHVKVLISSGYSSSMHPHDLALAGAAGFIHKPYQPEDLFSTIREILEAPTFSNKEKGPVN